LSYGQRALWFLQRMQPESTAYNISHAVRIAGELDAALLQEAFAQLVQRHAALRTVFVLENGEPIQRVQATGWSHFEKHDVRGLTETAVNDQLNEAAQVPFDLEKGPLLRVHLFVRSEQEHLLLLTMHHIITDFWSQGVLMQELQAVYAAMKQGATVELAALPMQFAEHVLQQQNLLDGVQGERMWTYWQKQLSGSLPVLNLPTDRPRPPVQSYRGAAHSFKVDGAVVQKIKAYGREQGTTLYMTLLATFQVLLHRYTGQDELLVGSPTTGRTRSKQANVVGYFVNPVVLRADLSEPLSFQAFLQQVRKTVLAALDHQEFPFPLLVERLQPQRDPSFPPLIQTMFVLQKSHLLDDAGMAALALQESGATLSGVLPMTAVPLESRAAQFDLTLTVAEYDGGITASFEYCSDLFDATTIERMAGHFQTLLAGIVQEPEQLVGQLPLLTSREEQQMLVEWNEGTQAYPAEVCLHHLFEQQAARTPDAVAVVYEQERLTYAELNRRANRLAHQLRDHGVGPDVLVGLSVDRSAEMVVGILAILKAGGAYVPIDPTVPQERFAFLLNDAKVAVLLTQQNWRDELQAEGATVICLDAVEEDLSEHDGREENLQVDVRADHLAYVIYTSGSTGKPKGVLINHANVVRLFAGTESWYGFNESDVWTLFHSYAFDFSVWELWGALLYGGRLVVVPYWVSRSPESFYQLLVDEQVTVLNQTPSAFRQLMQVEEASGVAPNLALRYVIFGGEALELQSLSTWYERHDDQRPQLVNMYGITETTVHVTYRPITAEDVRMGAGSVIGGPIPDLQVYVLDRHMQPVPIGVTGEMFVGGAGLARGYLNRPELTAERFISHPFSDDPSARLYRTGDLARFLPDGTLQYQGRIDHQVKIRGFRIELGEIEAVLNQHPAVRQAVATTQEVVPGEKQLV
ncbi:MAG: non-ribosomal peptide synthetase, partial [Tumebacillaceae bacterium]